MAVDYDPIKAHEYYEKHKKLKGRKKGTSTKGFSQKQNEQLMYAQSQLRKRQKRANTKARDRISIETSNEVTSMREARQRQIKNAVSVASKQIEQLKEKYDNATPEEQDAIRKQISDAIYNIRESTKAKVGRIQDQSSAETKRVRNRASRELKKETEKNQRSYERAEEKAKKKIKSGK